MSRRIWRLVRPQNMPEGFKGWLDAKGMAAGHERQYAAAAALLELQPDDDVLEVACGVGALLQRHAAGARYVAGLDHSPMQLGFARKRLADRIAAGTAELVLGDAHALPWEDARFSAVVCLNGLELISDPEKTLLEMRRVLRPGGRGSSPWGCVSRTRARGRSSPDWGSGRRAKKRPNRLFETPDSAKITISYLRSGRGPLGRLVNGLSWAMLGSDEARLVRAIAE